MSPRFFLAPFAKYQQTKISDGANIFGERERYIANYKSCVIILIAFFNHLKKNHKIKF